MTPNEREPCLRCGVNTDPMVPALGGFPCLGPCASCLLGVAMAPPEMPDLAGEWLGRYVIGRLLGKGGMGVVYEAFDTVLERTVALKILADDLEAPELQRTVLMIGSAGRNVRDQLVDEAKFAAALEHEHIVPVYEVGDHHGMAYLVMKRIDGGPLKTPAPDEKRAAKIALSIAKALDYAHRRGILHRDVKPANVLVDREEGRVFVTDFGLAAREGLAVGVAGTPPYMAPEVWRGKLGAISTAGDIWAMGVTLYELLMGRLPFEAESLEELMRKVIAEPPPALAGVHPDLAAVCLHCLEKDPSSRYPTAGELADDLARFLNGELPNVVHPGRPTRVWRWCLRHPITAGISLAVVVFLLLMTWGAVSIARDEETSKRAQIQESNRVIAGMVAGSVLSYLRGLSDAVHRVAEDERLGRALEEGREPDLDAICKDAYEHYDDPSHGLKLDGNSPFHLWYVQDTAGISKAIYQMPAENDIRGRDYAFRDYFKGAKALAHKGLHQTYVSYAHKSEVDGYYTLPISAPIYGSDKQWRGVLVAAIATTAKLGALVLDDGQHTAVLAAPHGPERTDPSLPDPPEYLILRHPSYSNHGEAIMLGDDQIRRLGRDSQEGDKHIEQWLELPSSRWVRSSDDYEDPLDKGRRRLAGFAPVGHTGFVVIVQRNEGDTLGPEKKLGKRLGRWAGIATTPGVFLVLFAALYDRKRRRARQRQSSAERRLE